jgi:hypothetical protein
VTWRSPQTAQTLGVSEEKPWRFAGINVKINGVIYKKLMDNK